MSLREWHRQKLEEYPPTDPPLWPLVWTVPDDAGPIRIILEAILSIVVLCIWCFVVFGMIGAVLYFMFR